jgi:hypothetical protein
MSHAIRNDPPIRCARLALMCVAIVAASDLAQAQSAQAPALRPLHFTVGAGVVWSGGYDIGDATAQLRGNAPGATPPPLTLFTAKSRVTPVTAPELRIGFAVTRRTAIELGVALTGPRVGVEISGDAEAPSQQLPGERLQQYLVAGGVTWQLPIRMGARMAPFVSGGATFLRQLHEDRTLAETGQVYYAGGGARYWLRGADGTSRALGLRGDVRVNFRANGIDFEDKMRTYPTFSVAVFVGF